MPGRGGRRSDHRGSIFYGRREDSAEQHLIVIARQTLTTRIFGHNNANQVPPANQPPPLSYPNLRAPTSTHSPINTPHDTCKTRRPATSRDHTANPRRDPEEQTRSTRCSTLCQIIENRFKPTNIYRLLASEKDRAESQFVISIGGVSFEQGEREGKESEYWMGPFFQAWAAYCGILTKLAPLGLQGDLACALYIYTMNLHELLERYAWEGVKSYHFQFHRKRISQCSQRARPAYRPA